MCVCEYARAFVHPPTPTTPTTMQQVQRVLELCKRGLGVHHGGLLPILKEGTCGRCWV